MNIYFIFSLVRILLFHVIKNFFDRLFFIMKLGRMSWLKSIFEMLLQSTHQSQVYGKCRYDPTYIYDRSLVKIL